LSAKHIQSISARRVYRDQELIKKMVTMPAEGQSEEPTIMLTPNLWSLLVNFLLLKKNSKKNCKTLKDGSRFGFYIYKLYK